MVHCVGAVEGVVRRPRLHGLVFALRSGVPALAIDPVPGGAKMSSEAAAVGWPASLRPDELGRLGEQLDWCLTDEARGAGVGRRGLGRRRTRPRRAAGGLGPPA